MQDREFKTIVLRRENAPSISFKGHVICQAATDFNLVAEERGQKWIERTYAAYKVETIKVKKAMWFDCVLYVVLKQDRRGNPSRFTAVEHFDKEIIDNAVIERCCLVRDSDPDMRKKVEEFFGNCIPAKKFLSYLFEGYETESIEVLIPEGLEHSKEST